MKMNLLEIVADILSDMNGDYVDSINDTDEAMQVAQIVKSTYQAMITNRNWPHTAQLVHLIPYSNNELPTHMKVDTEIKEMISVYYNKIKKDAERIDYVQIPYIDPDSFLRFVNRRNSTDPNTKIVVDPSGVQLLVSTNKAPEYYTSFDDETLVFDSYDSDVDDSLQSSKVQARAYVTPKFEMLDTFVPKLPEEAFAALLAEAKSSAMFRLKQMQDIKAEQESNRQQRWLSRKSWKVKEKDIYPENYGRNSRGGYKKDPTFRREN